MMRPVPPNREASIMTMTAIETRYAGCRFRSRLEARWAVFFDRLGITWEYEPQGYEFDGERYLPDFYLPKFRQYVEVKGDSEALRASLPKLRRFCAHSDKDVILLRDMPRLGLDRVNPVHYTLAKIDGEVRNLITTVIPNLIDGESAFLPTMASVTDEAMLASTPGAGFRGIHAGTALQEAYAAARSARFEHGESGGQAS